MRKIRIIVALAVLVAAFFISGTAQAQYWRWMPSGYHMWGSYREWPRGWQGFSPGHRYYGPGAYYPFSPWQRNPYYRY